VHVNAGLITVRAGSGAWTAPPAWAIWIPAGVEHTMRFIGRGTMRTCWFCPGTAESGEFEPGTAEPRSCSALVMTPLLRELTTRATQLGMLDERDPVETAIARLIVAELGRPGPPPFALPEPASPATIHAARLMETDDAGPTRAGSTAGLAAAVGLSQRTLERRFEAETGMTLGRWRQQRRLLTGLELIAGGTTIAKASATAGYSTSSAYIAAFRKAFGVTPARYLSPPGPAGTAGQGAG